MLAPFTVSGAAWGVYVVIRRPLDAGDRPVFVAALKRACAQVAALPRRGAFLDLRGADLISVPTEWMRAYVGIARAVDAQRVAALVPCWTSASRLVEALTTAGLLEKTKVMVADLDDMTALSNARRWVLEGADVIAALGDRVESTQS